MSMQPAGAAGGLTHTHTEYASELGLVATCGCHHRRTALPVSVVGPAVTRDLRLLLAYLLTLP